MEINEVFMANGIEFKVTFINQEKKRFVAEPLDKESILFQVGEKFNYENKWYIIVYVHETKKRITFEERN